jgi:fumarylacetoacetase
VPTAIEIPEGSGYGIDNLPYGVFSRAGEPPRVGVRVGDQVLDLVAALGDDVFSQPSLNAFMARGPSTWRETRERVVSMLGDEAARGQVSAWLLSLDQVSLLMPFEVSDYVDFYSSIHHARNLGRIFRPDQEPLMPNWRHLPVGYHGRSGTVVVSGTTVVRPRGQLPGPTGSPPTFGPSRRLDIEAEVGFVVGAGSELGVPVPASALADHVFGVVLVNDWSARDIQAWEYVPLGPFLGKSFATSISPWVVPLEALRAARVDPPDQEPAPLPHLRDPEGWALNIAMEVRLNGTVISRPPFAGTYWTPAQQLAHMTSNGARLRTGDLYASGTVSGEAREEWGSLIELSWNGRDPIHLDDGTTRTFLEDGDTVVISANATAPGGLRLALGEVAGRIEPALTDD